MLPQRTFLLKFLIIFLIWIWRFKIRFDYDSRLDEKKKLARLNVKKIKCSCKIKLAYSVFPNYLKGLYCERIAYTVQACGQFALIALIDLIISTWIPCISHKETVLLNTTCFTWQIQVTRWERDLNATGWLLTKALRVSCETALNGSSHWPPLVHRLTISTKKVQDDLWNVLASDKRIAHLLSSHTCVLLVNHYHWEILQFSVDRVTKRSRQQVSVQTTPDNLTHVLCESLAPDSLPSCRYNNFHSTGKAFN